MTPTASIKRAVRSALPGGIYRLIRQRRVRAQIGRYRTRRVAHSYAGHQLDIVLRDPLAEAWYDHDWGRQPEIDALTEGRLRPGATVFDLGAHQGVVALVLARVVSPGGRVVAVEAERHNAEVAEENRLLNGDANLAVLHAAVAEQSGIVYFSEGLNGSVQPGGRTGKVAVPAVTVDELARQFGPPDVVIIDVEGSEGPALRGSPATLAAGRTEFLVELHDGAALSQAGTTAEEVVSLLVNAGLQLRVAAAPEGPMTTDFLGLDAGLHLRGDRCYILASPSAVSRPL
jgi:FkbM family methyltransferase